MSIAIRAENISKAYQLGEIGTGTLSRDLERWFSRVRGKEDPFLRIGETNDRTTKGSSDVVWSLKDINFEIEQGDAVGIIGRNGAGKSTLLKVLSRVTSPTSGRITGKGRIASLLEVGTGFHPELTGRENIYLNGAILGMRKREINRKFDEIVEFAGVERYIDTPVKRYSSGMYVRLAFAVAAHLESEILIIDEVLAVGDAEFQKKCLGKMDNISKKQGKTILFVSHNMQSINQLCKSGILLVNGSVKESGKINKVIENYLQSEIQTRSEIDLNKVRVKKIGNRKVEFQKAELRKSANSRSTNIFSMGDAIHLVFSIKFNNPNERNVKTAVELRTEDGIKIANMIDIDSGFQVNYSDKQIETYSIILSNNILYPGKYYISLYAGDMSSIETYEYLEDCLGFEIIDGGILTSRNLPRNAGLIFFTPTWEKIQ